jgi:DNA-directed RNA polymerase subunit RPC12/RpoP
MTIIKMSEINEISNYDKSIIRMIDPTIELAENAMLRHRPDLFDEWDFVKNDLIGLDVYTVSYGSGKMASWKCMKCGSSYERTIEKTVQALQCSYCSGYKVNHTNSLANKKPQIASEWHPIKNGELTPHDVTCGRAVSVWWLGECGHEWKATILKRAGRGDKCPFCSNKRILIGFNDMWTTNPELASQLADLEDGYKYTQNSNVKVKWKCRECSTITTDLLINSINREGVSCPACSDGISYGEKFLYCILESANLDFECQKEFTEWSNGKRYDFYLPMYNWIIEVHGGQHYGTNGFEGLGGRTLKEEQANDNFKEVIAKDNGINEYIVIDARISSADVLLKSIESSKLNQIISTKDINIQQIEKRILKSLVIIACQLWSDGMLISTIADTLKLSRATIRKYLKNGRTAELCNYDEKESSVKKRKVVQLSSEDGEHIKTWGSIKEASNFFNVSSTVISRCAKGGRPNAAGFKWMYKENYEKEFGEIEIRKPS